MQAQTHSQCPPSSRARVFPILLQGFSYTTQACSQPANTARKDKGANFPRNNFQSVRGEDRDSSYYPSGGHFQGASAHFWDVPVDSSPLCLQTSRKHTLISAFPTSLVHSPYSTRLLPGLAFWVDHLHQILALFALLSGWPKPTLCGVWKAAVNWEQYLGGCAGAGGHTVTENFEQKVNFEGHSSQDLLYFPGDSPYVK